MSWLEELKNGLKDLRSPGEAERDFYPITPRALHALALARDEAQKSGHGILETEHVLFGLVSLGAGVAANVLATMGVNTATVRAKIPDRAQGGSSVAGSPDVKLAPVTKEVLAIARAEAKAHHHHYVGTEHLLLGMLQQRDSTAARILKSLDVDLDAARREILHALDPHFGNTAQPPNDASG